MSLEQIGEPLQKPPALKRIHLRPRRLRRAGRLHRPIDVFRVAERECRERARRRRIHVVERRAGGCGHLIAADQVPAALRTDAHSAGVSSGCAASARRSTSATWPRVASRTTTPSAIHASMTYGAQR